MTEDPTEPTQKPGQATSRGVAPVAERLVGGAAYFFAGVGIALCSGLVVLYALDPLLAAYVLGWATGGGRVGAIVVAVLLLVAAAAIGRRLATRGGL